MIKFIDENINNIEIALKEGYEEIMGITIKDGDPINDFIGWVTYIFTIVKNDINYTGRMNLLRYAEKEYLEAIGELVGVERIQEKGAKATIKYTFSKTFPSVVTIPKGHKVAAGNLYFGADENIELKIGEREVSGVVTCLTPGVIGNDLQIGEINIIVDDIPFLLSVSNTSISSGGVNQEDDESLRTRIQLKPTAFSTAGPVAAYKYHVLTAHQDIIDVHIYTPEESPGVVKVIPLLKNGVIPERSILEIVEKRLQDDSVRPFTDKVEVFAPTSTPYNINLKWWLSKENDVSIVTQNINNAVLEYRAWQKEKLGRDINPNKLIQLLIGAGAKRVEIIEPTFTKLDKTKIAQETSSITVSYQGVEDE